MIIYHLSMQALPDNSKFANKNIPLADIVDLREKGLSHAQIGKVLGCSASNVKWRLRQINTRLASLDTFKKVQTDLLTLKVKDMVTALTMDKIKSMAGRDLVTCIAILIDKVRLLDGESTQNISYKAYIERYDNLEVQKQAIKQRLAELRQLTGLSAIKAD